MRKRATNQEIRESKQASLEQLKEWEILIKRRRNLRIALALFGIGGAGSLFLAGTADMVTLSIVYSSIMVLFWLGFFRAAFKLGGLSYDIKKKSLELTGKLRGLLDKSNSQDLN